jgi:hypothetical protein
MIKNKIEIVLRTCARTGLFDQSRVPRIVSDDRFTMIRKCIHSLIISINNSDKDITLTVFDDQSDPKDVLEIKKILDMCKVPVTFFTTKVRGYNNSAYEQFKYGRDHGRELVYYVEDDYFHDPDAINLLVDTYNHFRSLSGSSEIAICPWEQPEEYEIKYIIPCKIFHFANHYWRTTISTSCTVLWPVELVRVGWKYFESMALDYGIVAGVEEMNTIGLLLNNAVNQRTNAEIPELSAIGFSPIPSIALHIHHFGQGTPKNLDTKMFDWQKRWQELADPNDLNSGSS